MRSVEDFNEFELQLYNKMMSKVEFAENGCWLSSWGLHDCGNPNFDYRVFNLKVGGKYIKFKCHRVSCLLFHGEPSKDRNFAIHSCDTPRCFSPFHLKWATCDENNKDRAEKGRSAEVVISRQLTHCKKAGHEFTEENTIWDYRLTKQGKSKGKKCRECGNAWGRKYDERKRREAGTPTRNFKKSKSSLDLISNA